VCGFFYTLSVSLRSPALPKGEPLASRFWLLVFALRALLQQGFADLSACLKGCAIAA
jgi:hypothetical protein